jgi:hypothetical protein
MASLICSAEISSAGIMNSREPQNTKDQKDEGLISGSLTMKEW